MIEPHQWVALLLATKAAKPQEDWGTYVDAFTAFDRGRIKELDHACMSSV